MKHIIFYFYKIIELMPTHFNIKKRLGFSLHDKQPRNDKECSLKIKSTMAVARKPTGINFEPNSFEKFKNL